MKKTLILLSAIILLFTACSKKSQIQPDAKSNAKAITKFVFTKADNPSLTADVEGIFSGNSINIVVGNIDKRALKPTITHSAQTISPNNSTAQDFTGPVTYTLTAEDGSTTNYIVNVTSNSKAITKFVFTKADNPSLTEDVEGTINGNEINVVLHGVDKSNLKATVTHTAKTINTITNFANPVTYTLAAEDGTTNNYTVKVENRDVYVLGTVEDNNGQEHAAYWKNGVKFLLDDNGSIISNTSAIAVHNNDVYITGSTYTSGNPPVGVYWKNGVKTSLIDCYTADNITIFNNDIYIVGKTNFYIYPNFTQTVYWKNGVKTDLNDGNKPGLDHLSIHVSKNNDVYVIGSLYSQSSQKFIISYWKNGMDNIVEAATETISPISILTTDNNDLYVFGKKNFATTGIYWKNGNKTEIPNTEIYAAVASNNDVYMTGREGNSINYWKNNVKYPLESDSHSRTPAAINIIGTDVYIAGYEYDYSLPLITYPVYWINGKSKIIPSATKCIIKGIAVIKN